MVAEHEKLFVYKIAREVAISMDHVARGLPDWRPDLKDQLRRASASVLLNIAEGAGEFSPAKKARFYRMARRSASECAAVLELGEALSPSPPNLEAPKRSLRQVAGLLTRMIKEMQRREELTRR